MNPKKMLTGLPRTSLNQRVSTSEEKFQCAICQYLLDGPLQFPCGHQICTPCARKLKQRRYVMSRIKEYSSLCNMLSDICCTQCQLFAMVWCDVLNRHSWTFTIWPSCGLGWLTQYSLSTLQMAITSNYKYKVRWAWILQEQVLSQVTIATQDCGWDYCYSYSYQPVTRYKKIWNQKSPYHATVFMI